MKKEIYRAPEASKIRMTSYRSYGPKHATMRSLPLKSLIELLHDGSHRAAVEALRDALPDGRGATIDHPEIWKVATICPAAEYVRKEGGMRLKQFNGVVLLDVQDVYTEEAAARVKQTAAQLPMTLAAFVGSSAMSVKVLVRYWPEDDSLPGTLEELERLHAAAHQRAAALYSTLLGRKLKEQPTEGIADTFRLSIDPEVYVNEEAVPLRVSVAATQQEQPEPPGPPADSAHYWYFSRLFMKAKEMALETLRADGRDPQHEPQLFLEEVVRHCHELRIPLAEARMRIVEGEDPQRAAEYRNFVNDYYTTHEQRIAPNSSRAQSLRQLEQMLQEDYEFYKNEINGTTYYRPRHTSGRWQTLIPAKRKGIAIEAMERGIGVTTKVVEDYLASDRIPLRNPVRDFLGQVRGTWDGRDRITELALCLGGENPRLPQFFMIWFQAMVQQWMGIHPEHGNAVAPLLCGPQGTGKSSFCRALLPQVLEWGYLDHIDLGKKNEVIRSLGQFLLINIDEFDQYRGNSQRGPLKNLLQLADVRARNMYESNFSIRQRMASFIATCNPMEVLIDETGSRRFICVKVTEDITLPKDLDHSQLYAQAVDCIEERRRHPERFSPEDPRGRCFFTDEEREAVEENNRHFRVRSGAVERFEDLLQPLAERRQRNDTSVELSRSEVFDYICRHSQQRFSNEDKRQLYARIDQLAAEGELYRRRANRAALYHFKLKGNPIFSV